MDKVLRFVAEAMEEAGVPYEFARWNSEVEYPYWVGDYIEVPNPNEDGMREVDFMLTGTTRGPWMGLEAHRAAIEAAFHPVSGRGWGFTDGTVVQGFYEASDVLPQDDMDLKRMQVDITIKEWRVF